MSMIDLIGAAAAPYLLVPVALPPSLAAYHHPIAYAVQAKVVVAPSGAAVSCTVVSGGDPKSDAEVCGELKAAQFAPATTADAAPAYGVFTPLSVWPADAKTLPVSDVDLTVKALPPGAGLRPRTDLALSVDAQGRVTRCDVAKSSGVPSLDRAACTSGAASMTMSPVKDSSGVLVPSVQSLQVSFAVYTPLVLKGGRYGDPGRIFP